MSRTASSFSSSFFFSSRRRHTRCLSDWSSDVCSSDLNRGASLAKRIMTPAEVALLIRAASSKRDRILIEVAYAGGLRVSEIINLTWARSEERRVGKECRCRGDAHHK